MIYSLFYHYDYHFHFYYYYFILGVEPKDGGGCSRRSWQTGNCAIIAIDLLQGGLSKMTYVYNGIRVK